MKTLVAVIAFNEEANIRKTLDDLLGSQFEFDIVVVDNASYDATAGICHEMGIDVLSHCINTGNSFGTVSTYFLYAFLKGYDILCQFDGDGQHRASELPAIIAPIKEGRADYVIGSRFLDKRGFQSSFFRRVGIAVFGKIIFLMTRRRITDSTSGFRAYSRPLIRFFAQRYRHEITDTNQLLLLSHYAGAGITEVPVIMDSREHGQSEFMFAKSAAFIFKGLINIVGCFLQRKIYRNAVRKKDGN